MLNNQLKAFSRINRGMLNMKLKKTSFPVSTSAYAGVWTGKQRDVNCLCNLSRSTPYSCKQSLRVKTWKLRNSNNTINQDPACPHVSTHTRLGTVELGERSVSLDFGSYCSYWVVKSLALYSPSLLAGGNKWSCDSVGLSFPDVLHYIRLSSPDVVCYIM